MLLCYFVTLWECFMEDHSYFNNITKTSSECCTENILPLSTFNVIGTLFEMINLLKMFFEHQIKMFLLKHNKNIQGMLANIVGTFPASWAITKLCLLKDMSQSQTWPTNLLPYVFTVHCHYPRMPTLINYPQSFKNEFGIFMNS